MNSLAELQSLLSSNGLDNVWNMIQHGDKEGLLNVLYLTKYSSIGWHVYLTSGWLVLFSLCFIFSFLSTAVSHVTKKEMVDSEEFDTEFINKWSKNSERIRSSLTMLQAVTIMLLVVAIENFFWCCTNWSETTEMVMETVMMAATLVLACCVPWFIGAALKLQIIKRWFGYMRFWAILTNPLNRICFYITEALMRAFNCKVSAFEVFDNALDEDSDDEEKELKNEEREMIRSIYSFGETIAREIMTPRPDVLAVEVGTPLDQVMQQALTRNLMRVPVFENTIDNVVGVLYLRDVMGDWARGNKEMSLKKAMREPFLIPESKRIAQVVIEMRKSKTQLAVVVDEYGGFAGIVTMNDIVSEILGEMPAEFKGEEAREIRKISEGVYSLDGAMLVDDLNSMLELGIPEEESYDSVGGFVMYRLGHFPEKGEETRGEGYTLKVSEIKGKRVERLLLTVTPREKD